MIMGRDEKRAPLKTPAKRLEKQAHENTMICGGEDRGIQTSSLPNNPNIKIQILICCPYTFPIVVVERRC